MQFILSAILLVATIEGICTAEVGKPEILHFVPKEKSYSMDIQEVHECISCHSDETPRRAFLHCLRLLSEANKDLAKQCCEQFYDGDFCNNASSGKIDFDRICHDPSKAVLVNRCFWKTTDTTSDDVVAYKQCRKKILESFCITRSED